MATGKSVEAVHADITTLQVDAIVNAANETLLGGGGVDGAIHRAAGPGLLEECRQLGGCRTGAAKVTGGYLLPASYVIHTVGPVWHGGAQDEAALLASCYRNALQLASELRAESVAFPGISTGVYGFPKAQAVPIAVTIVREHAASHELPAKIVFCCFSPDDLALYQSALSTSEF